MFFLFAEQAAQQAVAEFHMKNMGTRYVEVTSVTAEDARRALGIGAGSVDSHVVKMLGIPFAATDQDILAFFQVSLV